MRLVEDNQPSNKDLFSQFTTTPTVKRLGMLDSEINDILNREISEREKAKLYSQTLRKFLIYKQKHQNEENILRQKELELLTKKASTLKKPKKNNPRITRRLFTSPYQTPRLQSKSKKTKTKKKKKPKANSNIGNVSTEPEATTSNLYDQFREIETPILGDTKRWDAFLREKLGL